MYEALLAVAVGDVQITETVEEVLDVVAGQADVCGNFNAYSMSYADGTLTITGP